MWRPVGTSEIFQLLVMVLKQISSHQSFYSNLTNPYRPPHGHRLGRGPGWELCRQNMPTRKEVMEFLLGHGLHSGFLQTMTSAALLLCFASSAWQGQNWLMKTLSSGVCTQIMVSPPLLFGGHLTVRACFLYKMMINNGISHKGQLRRGTEIQNSIQV